MTKRALAMLFVLLLAEFPASSASAADLEAAIRATRENIANVYTPGYKRWKIAAHRGQYDISLDLSDGPRESEPFALSVEGQGFFALRGADGHVRYARTLRLRIVNQEGGARVLAEGGAPLTDRGWGVTLGPAVSFHHVQPDGHVVATDARGTNVDAGIFRLVRFPVPSMLTRDRRHSGLLLVGRAGAAIPQGGQASGELGRISPDQLERSNVAVADELHSLSMLTATRGRVPGSPQRRALQIEAARQNVANASRVGHRALCVVDGPERPRLARSWAQGVVRRTGSSYDLAIIGGGFFEVENERGQRGCTRAGRLHRDATSGRMTTSGGWRVLHQPLSGSLRPLALPANTRALRIDADGRIWAIPAGEGIEVHLGQLLLVRIPEDRLRSIGHDVFVADAGTRIARRPGVIVQGSVELSSVSLWEALADIIESAP